MPHLIKLNDNSLSRHRFFVCLFGKKARQRKTAGAETLNIRAMLLSESPKVDNKTAVAFSLSGRPRGVVLRVN